MILHPHASVVFCDDVRQENNGKLLHIGVYNDEILFDGPPPWTLLSLWCLIKYHEPQPDVLPTFGFRIRVETKTDGIVVLADLPFALPPAGMAQKSALDFEKDVVRLVSLNARVQIGFEFKEPAKMTVVVARDDEEVFAGRLRISQLTKDDAGRPNLT